MNADTAAARKAGPTRISFIFLGFIATSLGGGWALWSGPTSWPTGLIAFVFVTAVWLVSLCLHEFSHEGTATLIENKAPGEGLGRGLTRPYLSPLKYTHALLSIILPVLFVIMGGLGLPGGAVYIERGRIQGRWKHSLISAAGPLTNVAFAVVCTAPFWLDALEGVPLAFRFALAFLALLQVSAAILNFLPVPGLDGYGVIEPWLSHRVRREVAPLAPFGLIAVFALLWIPEVNQFFFGVVDGLLSALGVTDLETYCGYDLYRFWREADGLCTAPQS
ncbi:site-2 protease family protein [Streptomyces sp. ISL-87]|uniref:site-2 protease family protein n=1 Tax=Streptomyces sp. ISL-87 TaxID=2819188 RepID=UPI001BE72388|nr:site-2 protease family protein [Streptomyces sp. ISL-87]MBT2609918.1 site-2 protease family protein [Streptomyces sp. ISL-87]